MPVYHDAQMLPNVGMNFTMPAVRQAPGWDESVDNAWAAGTAGTLVVEITHDTDAPPGYVGSLKTTVTTLQDPDALPTDIFVQPFSAVDNLGISELSWGDVNPDSAKYATMGFWLKTNVPGDYGASLTLFDDSADPHQFTHVVTVTEADTWQWFTVVVPPFTSATISPMEVNTGLYFGVAAIIGSDFSGADADTWNDDGLSATWSNDFVSTNDNYLSITGAVFTPYPLDITAGESVLYQRSYQDEIRFSARRVETSYSDPSKVTLTFAIDDGDAIQAYHPEGTFEMFVPYAAAKKVAPTAASIVNDRAGTLNVVSYSTDGTTWADGGACTVTSFPHGFLIKHTIAASIRTAFAWVGDVTDA